VAVEFGQPGAEGYFIIIASQHEYMRSFRKSENKCSLTFTINTAAKKVPKRKIDEV
jgi:hypothetical protein